MPHLYAQPWGGHGMNTQACDYIKVDTALDTVFYENITDVEAVQMILY